MQKGIVIILLATITMGCKEKLDSWQIQYPAEVEDQIQLFKQYAPENVRAKKLTIVLTGHGLRTEEGQLCAGLSSPKKHKIYLDTTSSHWRQAKTALVLHELGHYVLDRRHNNNYFKHPSNTEITIPVSIMNIKAAVKEEYMMENMVLREYYMNELFFGF